MIHQGLLYTDGRLNILIGTPPDTDPIHNGWRRTSKGEAWASFDGPVKYRWNGLCFTEKGAVLVTPDSPPKQGDYKAWGGVRVSSSGHMYLATSGGSKAGGRRLKNDGTLVVQGLGYVKDFVNAPGQVDGITFSGGANGTRVNSAGLIEAKTTPRIDYDPVTLAPKGLLIEEARTNLALRSEEFDNASWTKTGITIGADAAVAPDGATTADSALMTGASQWVTQGTTIASSTTHTFTVFAKANGGTWALVRVGKTDNSIVYDVWFDISTGVVGTTASAGSPTATANSIEEFPDGWYRLRVTANIGANTDWKSEFTNTTADNSYTRDTTNANYFWGAQLEAASAPSSYIPTTTASVTRTADSVTDTTIAWFNATEGTIVAEWSNPVSLSTNGFVVLFDDTTTNEQIAVRVGLSLGQIAGFVADGGVGVATLNTGNVVLDEINRLAFSYKVNDFAASKAGAAVVTDTAGSLPTVTRMLFGSGGSANFLNGHIRRLTYYDTRLANALLQKLSA